jgi:hypothetical protein
MRLKVEFCALLFRERSEGDEEKEVLLFLNTMRRIEMSLNVNCVTDLGSLENR